MGIVSNLTGIDGAYNLYQQRISASEIEDITVDEAIQGKVSLKQKQFIANDAIQKVLAIEHDLIIDSLFDMNRTKDEISIF